MTNRNSEEIINKVKNFLKEKNFYEYLNTTEIISKKFTKEFNEIDSFKNKRNILLNTAWKDINSLGEPRPFLVIELGGSFLHLIKAEISESNQVKIIQNTTIDFYDKSKIYTQKKLFGDILNHLNSFIPETEKSLIKDCVFIFTFPIEQIIRDDGYIDAIAIKINKQILHEGIIGIKVGESLEKFAREQGYENLKVSVTNDTIPLLLASKYFEIHENKQFDATLAVIVGTGTNLAVGYDIFENGKDKFYMVNSEYAYFNSFPMSEFDEILENEDPSKGESMAEKKISGLWQPYIFKIIIEELIKAKIVPKDIGDIFNNLRLSSAEIEEQIKTNTFPTVYHDLLDFIWYEQTKRAAFLTGLALANAMKYVLDNNAKQTIRFGIIEVGGVIKKARAFKDTMYKSIDQELTRLDCKQKISYTALNMSNTSTFGSAVFNSILKQKL